VIFVIRRHPCWCTREIVAPVKRCRLPGLPLPLFHSSLCFFHPFGFFSWKKRLSALVTFGARARSLCLVQNPCRPTDRPRIRCAAQIGSSNTQLPVREKLFKPLKHAVKSPRTSNLQQLRILSCHFQNMLQGFLQKACPWNSILFVATVPSEALCLLRGATLCKYLRI
jgi:hypothetical protein